MTTHSAPMSEDLDHTIDHFWETIPPLWRLVRAYIRDAAAHKFGITVEQFHILRHVSKGAISMSQLAEAQHISRPAISQSIDALVHKGLVLRAANQQDRRYIQVQLTASGRALLEAIFQDTRSWMRSKLCVLSQSEMKSINQAITRLKEALEEPAA
ncbi:MAG: MarR family transcriptional regulator [Anaerolineales bacterium]|nr:MarR family transcriptional regulator [Anaerolineales bacterium]